MGFRFLVVSGLTFGFCPDFRFVVLWLHIRWLLVWRFWVCGVWYLLLCFSLLWVIQCGNAVFRFLLGVLGFGVFVLFWFSVVWHLLLDAGCCLGICLWFLVLRGVHNTRKWSFLGLAGFRVL